MVKEEKNHRRTRKRGQTCLSVGLKVVGLVRDTSPALPESLPDSN